MFKFQRGQASALGITGLLFIFLYGFLCVFIGVHLVNYDLLHLTGSTVPGIIALILALLLGFNFLIPASIVVAILVAFNILH